MINMKKIIQLNTKRHDFSQPAAETDAACWHGKNFPFRDTLRQSMRWFIPRIFFTAIIISFVGNLRGDLIIIVQENSEEIKVDIAQNDLFRSLNGFDIGIQITKRQFDQKVLACISLIQNHSPQDLSIDEYIEFVRVYNTIARLSDYGNDENYKKFMQLFREPVIHHAAITALQGRLARGGTYYSSKYDIYFGAPSNANSRYCIIQEKPKVEEENRKNSIGTDIGIQITKSQFDQKVSASISLMEDRLSGSSSVDELIEIIRVYNTISRMDNYGNNENYKKFMQLVHTPKVIRTVNFVLQANLTKDGLAYYSAKYDLYFGGTPHANSQYRIIQENPKTAGEIQKNLIGADIEITKSQFDQKVSACISLMENKTPQNLSVDEYIEIVRVFNVITSMENFGPAKGVRSFFITFQFQTKLTN